LGEVWLNNLFFLLQSPLSKEIVTRGNSGQAAACRDAINVKPSPLHVLESNEEIGNNIPQKVKIVRPDFSRAKTKCHRGTPDARCHSERSSANNKHHPISTRFGNRAGRLP
jgi:hypothetical protein